MTSEVTIDWENDVLNCQVQDLNTVSSLYTCWSLKSRKQMCLLKEQMSYNAVQKS